jgi:aryl-alcohol dehydrogenase-like predicted oxidoreductase
MEKRVLGKTGMRVSVLGFGGAEIGFENASLQTVEKMLSSALDAGLNVIDTAECYLRSEELIGKAVSHRRSQYYLFTKCGHGANYSIEEWSKDQINRSVERSLQRLQTDYLDLIQLHSCSEEILKKGEVIETLQAIKKAGKARFIGYSGDGTAAAYAIKTNAFDTLQTSINIADQEAIDLTIPLAIEKNMGIIAKRPIANAAWKNNSKPANEYHQPYWERLQELKYDFLNGNLAKSISIALRFTLSLDGVHTAIVGTSKPERFQENIKYISDGKLSSLELNNIRSRWKSVAKNWTGQT